MNLFGRFVRFGLVGGTGVLVNQAMLYILHDPKRLALPLVPSAAISWQLALINNFVWNEAWTFADRVGGAKGGSGRLGRFVRFEMICLVGLAISLAVLTSLVKRTGVHYLVANAVAIGVAMSWNFLVNHRLNWSKNNSGGTGGLTGRDASRVGPIERPAGEPSRPAAAPRQDP